MASGSISAPRREACPWYPICRSSPSLAMTDVESPVQLSLYEPCVPEVVARIVVVSPSKKLVLRNPMTRGSRPRAARSAANAASARSSTVRSRMGPWIASPARSGAPLAMRRSGSASVTALIAWAAATHSSMPPADRSLVNAKPMRCESMTRMPIPRSPWTRTFSTAASFTSTDVDADSRKNTSARAPWRRSEPIARSTTASFVSRSLTRFAPCSSNGLRPLPRSRLVGFGRRGEAAPPSCLDLPADHDRGDPQRRLCVGDGRALPVLAAGAGRVAEVPAHHVDLAHELRPLPDERRSAQRLGQAPVADAVRLGHLEREVPADDVDLAAAHLPDEDAVVDRREDVRGVADRKSVV